MFDFWNEFFANQMVGHVHLGFGERQMLFFDGK